MFDFQACLGLSSPNYLGLDFPRRFLLEGPTNSGNPLPPEAEAQLAEYRALVHEAEEAVQRAQERLGAISKQAEAETERALEVVQAMIADKVVAAELVAEAWADYETAITKARSQVLRAKGTPGEEHRR